MSDGQAHSPQYLGSVVKAVLFMKGDSVSTAVFTADIDGKTREARKGLSDKISDATITTVACIDERTRWGLWNLPGGIILVWWEFSDEFEDFFRLRAGRSGTFFVHLYCGYMFCELGLNTIEAQQNLIMYVKQDVAEMNAKHGCSFEVVVEEDGSARDYMLAA